MLAGTLLLVAAPSGVSGQLSSNRTEVVFRAGPNQARAEVIQVSNHGDRTVQAVVRLEDWDREENGTNRWGEYGSKAGSCGAALEVFPLTVSLDPGATQSIRVSLDSTVALTRECWAAAIVETALPRLEGGQQVNYMLRVATKIYLQPVGLIARGEVVAMDVVPAPDTLGPTRNSVELRFANTGEKHLETRGELQVRRPDNSVAATVPVPTLYTLPGAYSRTKVVLPELPAGRYVLLAILDFGGSDLAAAQLEYEEEG